MVGGSELNIAVSICGAREECVCDSTLSSDFDSLAPNLRDHAMTEWVCLVIVRVTCAKTLSSRMRKVEAAEGLESHVVFPNVTVE